MKISREGGMILSVILLSFVSVVVLLYYLVAKCEWCEWLIGVAAVLGAMWLLIMTFFREPKRMIELDEELIYAPCDGRVVVTELVDEDECLTEQMMQISIFMSVANVHVNWAPISGVVEYFKHHHGKFLFAWNPKSSKENEHTTVVIRHSTGERVLVRQVAGYVARRIVCYLGEGDSAEQGRKFGFIKFGSRIDILLPKSSQPLVSLGDRVVGARSVIAKF